MGLSLDTLSQALALLFFTGIFIRALHTAPVPCLVFAATSHRLKGDSQ